MHLSLVLLLSFVPQAFTDLATISAGDYPLGCVECNANKQAVRTATLPSFRIGTTEVTVADYRECVDAGSCQAPAEGPHSTYHAPGLDEHPVNHVTWDDAFAFCDWAGQRLCTEDEWEASARGTAGRLTTWPGEQPPTCAEVVANDRAGCGAAGTEPVGSRPAGNTPEGVSDLLGNVGEWTATCTSSVPVDDQTICTYRAVRGGSFGTEMGILRTTSRQEAAPYVRARTIGIRCCSSL